MKEGPIVAEVRRVRDELARKFNYDVHAIFQDLRRRQGKTVTMEELRSETGKAAPSRPSRVAEGKPHYQAKKPRKA